MPPAWGVKNLFGLRLHPAASRFEGARRSSSVLSLDVVNGAPIRSANFGVCGGETLLNGWSTPGPSPIYWDL